jgi:hypothetical protein
LEREEEDEQRGGDGYRAGGEQYYRSRRMPAISAHGHGSAPSAVITQCGRLDQPGSSPFRCRICHLPVKLGALLINYQDGDEPGATDHGRDL